MGCFLIPKFPKGDLQRNLKKKKKLKRTFCIIPVSSSCQYEDSNSSISVQSHRKATDIVWGACSNCISLFFFTFKDGLLRFFASSDPWLINYISLGWKEPHLQHA